MFCTNDVKPLAIGIQVMNSAKKSLAASAAMLPVYFTTIGNRAGNFSHILHQIFSSLILECCIVPYCIKTSKSILQLEILLFKYYS
jgi:hypothetical protein